MWRIGNEGGQEVNTPLTDDEYRELAGECTKCVHYDYDAATFTVECYECKRYYSDMFEDKKIKGNFKMQKTK